MANNKKYELFEKIKKSDEYYNALQRLKNDPDLLEDYNTNFRNSINQHHTQNANAKTST
tara:strand:+ start:61 stop:237 length:177 start_codon:yes stop_codon:yes gene_type:complete